MVTQAQIEQIISAEVLNFRRPALARNAARKIMELIAGPVHDESFWAVADRWLEAEANLEAARSRLADIKAANGL